jgi:hypothetical protein
MCNQDWETTAAVILIGILTTKPLIQWTPLNGITDNGINRLMGSNLAHLTSPK